jgi:hypothetical protein
MDISLKKRIKRIEEMVDKVLTRKGDPQTEEENLKSTLRQKQTTGSEHCGAALDDQHVIEPRL